MKKIASGTVLDHIHAGKSLRVLELLKPKGKKPVGVVLFVKSGKMKKKDMIFFEGVKLKKPQIKKIAKISRKITVNTISKQKVAKKQRANGNHGGKKK